eukprot:COSAG02_NODE_12544_length_1527_cov_3.830532_2_plen_47_part_01
MKRGSNDAALNQPKKEEVAKSGNINGRKDHRASAREQREARVRARAR